MEFFKDKDRLMLAASAAMLFIVVAGLINRALLQWFRRHPPASWLGKVLFAGVGDGGASQERLSSGARAFLSLLSVCSLLAALGGLLLGVLVLAGVFDQPELKSYAAWAAGLLIAGVGGIYYGGSVRGWPRR
jgi:hypothetical protein